MKACLKRKNVQGSCYSAIIKINNCMNQTLCPVNAVLWTTGFASTVFSKNYKVVSVFNELNTMPWRYVGEWRHSSTILDLDTRCRWVVSITARPLYLWRKSPRYTSCRRLGGPQNRSGRRKKKQSFSFWESNPGRAVRSSSQYRLSYPDSMINLSMQIKRT
jgi:hypothetical protein